MRRKPFKAAGGVVISCGKCGFGHLTLEEAQACPPWDQIIAGCASSGHPIIRRDWHFGSTEQCACGQRSEPTEEATPPPQAAS